MKVVRESKVLVVPILYLTCKVSEPLLLKSLLAFLCNYDREVKIAVKNVKKSFNHVLSRLLHFLMLTFFLCKIPTLQNTQLQCYVTFFLPFR